MHGTGQCWRSNGVALKIAPPIKIAPKRPKTFKNVQNVQKTLKNAKNVQNVRNAQIVRNFSREAPSKPEVSQSPRPQLPWPRPQRTWWSSHLRSLHHTSCHWLRTRRCPWLRPRQRPWRGGGRRGGRSYGRSGGRGSGSRSSGRSGGRGRGHSAHGGRVTFAACITLLVIAWSRCIIWSTVAVSAMVGL